MRLTITKRCFEERTAMNNVVKWSRLLAIFLAFGLVFSAIPQLGQPAQAASPDIVISQVYGGGGNSGATYTHDFIELFNRGTTLVDVAGWSVQYASATGSTWQVTALSGAIQPGQYYLIQQAQGAGGTTPLPTPDATGTIPMSATNGKVALVSNITNLSGTCPSGAGIVDFVGFGGTANCFEGSGPTPTLSNTTAALRKAGGCTDTDDNAADFAADMPAPRNTASPFNNCSGGVDPLINEFVFNHVGTDTHEYVEIFGEPNQDYSVYTILQIEGDGAGAGVIDSAHTVGTTDVNGFWMTGFLSNVFENGTVSLLLVEDFTGSVGQDVDTNNDGILDFTPWSRIVDDVAVSDGGAGDRTYASTVLAPGFDGNTFTPGGASRIPNGVDTNSVSDWTRNNFEGAGLPGFTASAAPGEALNTPGVVNEAVPPPPPGGVCGDEFTPIYAIQGIGTASPFVGQILATEGVVVGDFTGPPRLNGFFVQDPTGDGDPETSDGIFVFVPAANPFHGVEVTEGDLVRVFARVIEFFGLTQLDLVQSLTVCDTGILVEPTPVNLPALEPVSGVPFLERYEGMLVTFPQELTATDHFNLGRFGEVTLSVDGRLFIPTNIVSPGADANALQAENDSRQILLDDGSNLQNPVPPPPFFAADGTLRLGDTTQDLTGVMSFAFSAYRIQPTQTVEFIRVNERTQFPEEVGGTIRVASFNVLNYFTTLDTGAPICGPNQDQGCRGANNLFEFERQRTKIIEAILRLDADVVGLIELENNPSASLQDLVDGLNDATSPGTYDFIDTDTIGSDAIKQGIIYQVARVTPVGAFAILDSSVDARFLDDKNRPVLAQTFDAAGEIFTVAVNHLKSKGSPCDDVGDPDMGDGQGNCNLTRTQAALAMVDWLAMDPTGSGDPDIFILGDLNAYRLEDPISAIKEEGGYTDLVDLFIGPQAYSFVFFGQAGYLDHALATPSLTDRVTGVTLWAINADEPRALDYNDFNQPSLFQPDQFRSSDHDPVMVGFCDAVSPVVSVSVTPDVLWPPLHQYVRVTASVSVFDNFDPSPLLELVSVTSNEPDNGLGDGDMPNDIVIIDDFTFDLRAERSGLGDGRIYTITYRAMDSCGNSTLASATVTVPLSQGNLAKLRP
jgi:uncharacterized protein